MKNIFITLLVLMIAFLSACSKPEVITTDEVMKVISEFDKGWLEKDSAIVNKVLAPEYVYYTQSGGIFSRKIIANASETPRFGILSIKKAKPTIATPTMIY